MTTMKKSVSERQWQRQQQQNRKKYVNKKRRQVKTHTEFIRYKTGCMLIVIKNDNENEFNGEYVGVVEIEYITVLHFHCLS